MIANLLPILEILPLGILLLFSFIIVVFILTHDYLTEYLRFAAFAYSFRYNNDAIYRGKFEYSRHTMFFT